MKTKSKLWLAGCVAAALVSLAGCSGSSDDGNSNGAAGPQGPGESANTVPDSAGSSVASFMAYLMGLDPNDEKSEPLLIKDSFVVPPDEGNEGQPLS